MTDEEFKEHLDQLGGNLESWPAPLKVAGLSLLAGSEDARCLLAEMLMIEDALRDPGPPPPPGLAQRIFAAAFAEVDAEEGDTGDGDKGDARQHSSG